MAKATLALILALGMRVGFSPPSEAQTREAIELAGEALRLDDSDSMVLGLAGCALSDAGEIPRAIPILNKAIDRNPSNAHAFAALAFADLQINKIDNAIEGMTRAIAISPLDNRLSIWRSILAMAYLAANNVDAALDQAQRAVAGDDLTYLSRVVLTAVYVTCGDDEKARRSLEDCRRVKPDISPEHIVPIVGRELGSEITKLLEPVS
jgi:tetratricopeptide (TPR) repeat protein